MGFEEMTKYIYDAGLNFIDNCAFIPTASKTPISLFVSQHNKRC